MRRLVLAGTLLAVAGLGAGCGSTEGERPGPRSDVGVLKALSGHEGDPAAESWAPWPQAMYDAQHSGASPAVGPRTGRVRWSRRLEGNLTPGPVVGADGTVYAASNAGVLHALDPGTGRDRWRLDEHGGYGNDQSTSPAVLPDALVLWPGPRGNLVAVTPDGEVAWRLGLGGQVTSPAVRADGDVVVGNDAGLLVGLHPTSSGPGEQWRVDLDDRSYGSPALSADGSTAYQTGVSGIYAVRDGAVLWHSTAPSDIVEVSAAVAPDETVVVGTNDPYEYGLDPEDGSVRWRYDRHRITYSSPVVTRDGLAYFGDHNNKVTAVDAATGELAFQFQGSDKDVNPGGIGIWTSVLVDAEHAAYVGTREGLVYGVDRDGELLFSVDNDSTVDSYPALTADGALIIGTTDGTLLAIADD